MSSVIVMNVSLYASTLLPIEYSMTPDKADSNIGTCSGAYRGFSGVKSPREIPATITAFSTSITTNPSILTAILVGASTIAFENLFLVKKKRFTGSSRANRRISRFAKKQLLVHGLLRAIRHGLFQFS